jgi:hypothetical protein
MFGKPILSLRVSRPARHFVRPFSPSAELARKRKQRLLLSRTSVLLGPRQRLCTRQPLARKQANNLKFPHNPTFHCSPLAFTNFLHSVYGSTTTLPTITLTEYSSTVLVPRYALALRKAHLWIRLDRRKALTSFWFLVVATAVPTHPLTNAPLPPPPPPTTLRIPRPQPC